VEDPTLVGSAEGETPGESAPASPGPVAVLEVEDRAVTTSSVRLRHWRVGSRDVHHLLDPRTGEPGGNGLASVTVVHPDPVVAETWGKVLFLAGPGGIASEAAGRGLAALWIDRFGTMECSSEMEQYVIWRKQ
jgi:thiamine biosynthesis lipoprotein